MPQLTLSKRVRRYRELEAAWAVVKSSALKSGSSEIRGEAQEFSNSASSNIRRISGQLSAGTFKFQPAKGILKQRGSGKKPRPIVVAPIESRVVQRAILQVVQSIPSVNKVLTAGVNFGGVPGDGFGVPAAIAKAVACAQAGGYFIRTDIKSFFTTVSKPAAVGAIAANFDGDDCFASLFSRAVEVEIADAAKYGENVELFPIYDVGVAQGSSLSPLLCNYLLRDFDQEMNCRGISCIRYIDDFILFGPDEHRTSKAFRAGLNMLKGMGLSAYDPYNPADKTKAERGRAEGGFVFLGCDVRPNRVRPMKNKCDELVDRLRGLFDESIAAVRGLHKGSVPLRQEHTSTGTIYLASNTVRAWGSSYAFCSDDRLMAAVNSRIEEAFGFYRDRFSNALKGLSDRERMLAVGMTSVLDCKKDDSPTSARTLAMAFTAKMPISIVARAREASETKSRESRPTDATHRQEQPELASRQGLRIRSPGA